jgi:NitT/TauT family transport system permease protein
MKVEPAVNEAAADPGTRAGGKSVATPVATPVAAPPWRQPLAHLVFLAITLGSWEYASNQGWLSATFFGQPSGIARFLWDNIADGKLWTDLGWTLAGTILAFALGASAAVGIGLAFVRMPALEHFLEPYFSALNVMPRIALAPLFILWFGLGLGSKVAIGFSLTFFIVLSATVAGMRGVSADHVTLCRTLGARPAQLFLSVTLPGAVPVLFSGLRLGLIYALLGVVGGEIIASEKGLGQALAYLSSTFNVNGVMALLLVLALLGVSVMRGMTWLEKRLLHWQ